jgi:hypothetical protein
MLCAVAIAGAEGGVVENFPKGIKVRDKAMTPTTTTIVREAEMDMKRRLQRASGSRMRQLLATFWPRSVGTNGSNVIGKPRRSIDREQQEYTPFYE